MAKKVQDSKPGPEIEPVLAVLETLRSDLQLEGPSTALLLYALLQLPGTKAAYLLGGLEGSLRARLAVESLEQTRALHNNISREHILYAARRIALEVCKDGTIDSRHLLMTCLVGSGFLANPPELPIHSTKTRDILGQSNTATRAMTFAGMDAAVFLDKVRRYSSKKRKLLKGLPNFVMLWRYQDRIRALRLEEIGEFFHSKTSRLSGFPVTLGLPDHSIAKPLDSILEFEELLNDPATPESEFQRFFERNPEFLMTDEHVAVRSGISLTGGSEEYHGLRPDFFLQRRDVPYWDIAELKLPGARVVRGRPQRRGWAAAVHSALDQLREYRRYFENRRLAQRVLEATGLEVYYPKLTLIIGRDAAFGTYQERQKLVPPEARVLTYDDILRLAKHRSLVLPFGLLQT